MVERIELLTSRHEQAPLVDYDWEGWGSDAPLPFILPGKASAVIVLKPKEVLPKDARIRVWYGSGKSSGCLDPHLAMGTLAEKTVLPPESLALRRPPKDTT
jgi:hypothetical protein